MVNINRLAWVEEQEANERGLTIVGDPDSLLNAMEAFGLEIDEVPRDQFKEFLARLDEAKEFQTGNYRVIISGPHSSSGQDHAHVKLMNGSQIWSVNKDGTGHDGYHGVRMEKKPYELLLNKGFTLASDRYIESTEDQDLPKITIRMNG